MDILPEVLGIVAFLMDNGAGVLGVALFPMDNGTDVLGAAEMSIDILPEVLGVVVFPMNNGVDVLGVAEMSMDNCADVPGVGHNAPSTGGARSAIGKDLSGRCPLAAGPELKQLPTASRSKAPLQDHGNHHHMQAHEASDHGGDAHEGAHDPAGHVEQSEFPRCGVALGGA
ncbi:MAG: hypothetical protein ABI599_11050 [Flavobacteriales bacterium]